MAYDINQWICNLAVAYGQRHWHTRLRVLSLFSRRCATCGSQWRDDH